MVLGVGKGTCYQPQFDSRTSMVQGEEGFFQLSWDLGTLGSGMCMPSHK